MSRVSINRRLDRLRDTLLPPGTMEWRIDRLPADLKRLHQLWRERADRIILAHQKRGGANRYALAIDGDTIAPPMPFAVHAALWPNGTGVPSIPADASTAEAAAIYQQFLEGQN